MSVIGHFFVETEEENKRYTICTTCPFFSKTTKLCLECKCFMPAKVKLPMAQCPKNKWFKKSN
jgi:hypothetical protein